MQLVKQMFEDRAVQLARMLAEERANVNKGRTEAAQAEVNIHAIEGALKDVGFWIDLLDKPEGENAPAEVPAPAKETAEDSA